MKKIGIDARLYFQTGVGTYLRNLLHYLPKILPSSLQIFVYVLSKDIEHIDFVESRFVIRGVDAPWHTVREQTVFYRALMRDELDLMHFTYFSYPILYKQPFIATIHDITPLFYKTGKASTRHPFVYEIKHLAFQHVLSSQVKNAKRIITPTAWVKKQIIETYGQQYADNIQSIPEGVSYELIHSVENISLKNKFTKPFFLYVGNFYPHKNVERLIKAFCHSRKGGNLKDVSLLLAGPNNMFAQKFKKKIERKNITGIYFYHNGSDEDLVYLYRHAQALVNPSLSEGFGLPLLEATYFNTPVIASDLPVFTEIMDDQYISFDPNDTEDIAQKLSDFIKNPKNFVDYQSIVDRFSFERMTEEIVNLYTSLI